MHLNVCLGVSTISYLFSCCPDVCIVTHRREGTGPSSRESLFSSICRHPSHPVLLSGTHRDYTCTHRPVMSPVSNRGVRPQKADPANCTRESLPYPHPSVPPVQKVLSETGPHLVSERRGRYFNYDIPYLAFFLIRITIFSMPLLGDEYIAFVFFWILLYIPSSAILSASSSRNVSVDMPYLE